MKLNRMAKMIVAVMMGTLSVSAQQAGAAQMSRPNAQVVKNFGRLPLTFEANQGQASGQVKFLSRGKGYTALLTAGGMVLNLRTSRIESSKSGNRGAEIAQHHIAVPFARGESKSESCGRGFATWPSELFFRQRRFAVAHKPADLRQDSI